MYYYYTTTNSIPRLLSHLALSSDSEFTNNIHRLHDTYKIPELNPFKDFTVLFTDKSYLFDSITNDNLVIIVFNKLEDFKNICYYTKIKNNKMESSGEDDSDIIILNKSIQFNPKNVKKIIFNSNSSKLQTIADCEINKTSKGVSFLTKKFKISTLAEKEYPFKNINLSYLNDIPRNKDFSFKIEDGYLGFKLSTFYSLYDSEDSFLKKFKIFKQNIIDDIASSNNKNKNENIIDSINGICNIIYNWSKSKKNKSNSLNIDMLNLYKSIVDYKRKSNKIDNDKLKFENNFNFKEIVENKLIKKIEEIKKRAEKITENAKEAQAYFFEEFIGVKIIQDCKKNKHLRDDQLEFLNNIKKNNGSPDFDFEKLHFIIARHSPVYAKILLEKIYIEKIENNNLNEKSFENLKELLFHIEKRLRSADNIKLSVKPFSRLESSNKIILSDKLNYNNDNLRLFKEILNSINSYYSTTMCYRTNNLTQDNKVNILKHVGLEIKKSDKFNENILNELRNIVRYFISPIDVIDVKNPVLSSFYKFLMNPIDLEKLLKTINSEEDGFYIAGFYGINYGFYLTEKNIWGFNMGFFFI